MGKVTGQKMTADERAGKKTWYCQNDGSELDEPQSADPTGTLKCPECGFSWWAELPPTPEDVEERQEAIKRAEKVRDDAFKAAKVADPRKAKTSSEKRS